MRICKEKLLKTKAVENIINTMHAFQNSSTSVFTNFNQNNPSGSSGTFRIDDNGVKGQGTYTIVNGVPRIGLQLEIVGALDKPNDSGTAVITSLPSNNGPNTPPSANNGPNTSLPPNSGASASLPPNNRPSASLPPNSGPSTSLPTNSGPSTSNPPNNPPITSIAPNPEVANPTPKVVLTAEG